MRGRKRLGEGEANGLERGLEEEEEPPSSPCGDGGGAAAPASWPCRPRSLRATPKLASSTSIAQLKKKESNRLQDGRPATSAKSHERRVARTEKKIPCELVMYSERCSVDARTRADVAALVEQARLPVLRSECYPTSERGVPGVANFLPRRARVVESHRRARLAKRSRSHSDSGAAPRDTRRARSC